MTGDVVPLRPRRLSSDELGMSIAYGPSTACSIPIDVKDFAFPSGGAALQDFIAERMDESARSCGVSWTSVESAREHLAEQVDGKVAGENSVAAVPVHVILAYAMHLERLVAAWQAEGGAA